MLQRFQDRVGTAGLVVAVVALVLALGGGAYAASGALTSKQKKEVTKIAQTEAKKFAGKPGAAGTNGSNGSNGAKGDTGGAGPEGKQGPQGIQGPRGEEGEEGVEGSPWTAGGTLPKGKTETGTWAIGTETAENPAASAALSFTIPLASTTGVSTHFINVAGEEEEFGAPAGPKPASCPGTAVSPTALPGTLCVYETSRSSELGVGNGIGFEAQLGGLKTAGSVLGFFVEPGGHALGTWAVTAPTS
jgi:hypothetical protein